MATLILMGDKAQSLRAVYAALSSFASFTSASLRPLTAAVSNTANSASTTTTNAATGASLSNSDIGADRKAVLQYGFSRLDPAREARRRLTATTIVSVQAQKQQPLLQLLPLGGPMEVADNAVAELLSPDGSRNVLLRVEPPNSNNNKSGTAKKKQFVEFWEGTSIIKAIDVSDIHADFFVNDDFFGSLVWSEDGKYVSYVAEKAAPDMKDATALKKFALKEDWGEKYTKKSSSVIVIINVATGVAKVLDHLPGSTGQVSFLPNSEGIVFTSVEHAPRQYGLKFCFNRWMHIYTCDLEGNNLQKLSNDEGCSRSAKIIPNRNRMLYLTSDAAGPHISTSRIVSYDLANRTSKVLVDIPAEVDGHSDFQGLYVTNFGRNCMLFDDEWILFHSPARCRRTLLAVHVDNGTVVDITPSTSPYAWTLHTCFENLIVASRSDPCTPEELMIGLVHRENSTIKVLNWISVHSPSPSILCDYTSRLQFSVHASPSSNSLEAIVLQPSAEGKSKRATTIAAVDSTNVESSEISKLKKTATPSSKSTDFVGSPNISYACNPATKEINILDLKIGKEAEGGPLPLVVVPHGGPHSAFSGDYSAYLATLAYFGFAVAMVNYTGSMGYGEKSIRRLLGKVGSLDVEEVQRITVELITANKYDSENIFVFGGSHGGFLGAHLTAQYPTFYRAAVLRNPVINIASNYAASDIPDWSFVEAGIVYDLRHPPLVTTDVYAKMFDASPISRAQKVQTPTLIMLGETDRRVPNYQGLEWYHALRHRGVDVRLLSFADTGHALDSVEAERSGIDAIFSFLCEHLSTSISGSASESTST